MKVLLTGIDGYLGSVVAPVLMLQGHAVVGLDTGYHSAGCLYHPAADRPASLDRDLRRVTADVLSGIEAVVHMAELSNDPMGQLAPHITHDINHQGSVRLAQLARQAGVERFVYMSSCSVYGVAVDGYVTEESALNPQTAYAECKTLVERDLRPMANERFSPTILRNATAYGASPRMRFDLVLNNLSGLAYTARQIIMTSDGSPWRPLVHALDIAKAIACTLAAPRQVVHNETFNVGDTRHNWRVREIADIVADVFPGCSVRFGDSGSDNRSYRVSFDKINDRLPGFACAWDARRGAEQLRQVFERVDLSAEDFLGRGFTRMKQLEYLVRTGQIDDDFYWRTT